MANEDDRTYVWVRNSALRSSCGVSSTNDEHETNKKEKSSNNASTKKRGTSEEEKTWEWCLAFYRSEQVRGRSLHHYSLIPRSRDEQAPDSGICTIDESRTNSLYESGDLFPANDWEVFGLNGNHDEEKLRNGDSNDDAASVTNRRETSYLIHKPVNKTTDNLIDLAHLNEPSVVNALRNRHQQSQLDATKMYTYSGDILLAVNPFRNDEAIKIYNESYAEQYRKEGERCWWEKRQGGNDINDRERMEKTEEILGPHVFGVADRIFRTMMTRLHPMTSIGDFRVKGNTDLGMTKNTDKINLSVLVSGDSGAGKTVTTKLLLGYLSKLCYRSPNFALSFTQTREDIPPEQTLLKYNQILESFGNARTARNDNSSRFGKYTEMRFSAIHDGVHIGGRCTSNTSERTGKSIHSSLGATLVGTRIETYLLERVRLVRQSRDERNYHIFYELCTLKNESNKCDNFDDSYSRQQLVSKFGLSEYGMEDFSLINSSGTYHRRDGVSDASTFAKLCDAMTATGFKKEEQVDVFALIAALLHLSNLTFSENEDGVITLQNSPHLDYVEDLLGLPATRLSGTLCQQHILVNGKVLSKAFTVEDAKKGVDSLIKGLYVAMFDGLVERINASLEGEQMGKESDASIGILDIFGFESFPRNSFEQLCINTCNEALQRQFNRSVIVSEQVEYKREGIPWNDVELLDNDDVVKLIENGIFSVLNDQCKLRNSTDASFLKALLNRSSTERIQASSLQVSSRLFEVKHYAGLVEYSVEGMLEKNRDKLSVTGCELLLSSSNGFVKTIGEALTSISKGRSSRKSSISNEFIVQLQVLTCKIDESSPHYIKCLKPNEKFLPEVFDEALIADQLRSAGVIEAMRVSRQGYPHRVSYANFVTRYRVLGMTAPCTVEDKNRELAKALVHTLEEKNVGGSGDKGLNHDVGIQMGKTKIFLRHRAYDELEKLRTRKIASSAVRIQCFARKLICQKLYRMQRYSILKVQCFFRLTIAKGIFTKFATQKRFCLQIQSQGRRYIAVKRLRKAVDSVSAIQSAWRSFLRRSVVKRTIEDVLTVVSDVPPCSEAKYLRSTRNHAEVLPYANASENTAEGSEVTEKELTRLAEVATSEDSSERCVEDLLRYIDTLEKNVLELREKCKQLEDVVEDNNTEMKAMRNYHRIVALQCKGLKIEAKRNHAKMKNVLEEKLAAENKSSALENELRQILREVQFFRKRSKRIFESRSARVSP